MAFWGFATELPGALLPDPSSLLTVSGSSHACFMIIGIIHHSHIAVISTKKEHVKCRNVRVVSETVAQITVHRMS